MEEEKISRGVNMTNVVKLIKFLKLRIEDKPYNKVKELTPEEEEIWRLKDNRNEY